jgi:hypothetical protein
MKPYLGVTGELHVGRPTVYESDAEHRPYGVVFEDDGRTGYFYARDYNQSDVPFVDALHIYSVKGVLDADRPSTLRIIWSHDWTKSALLLNDMPHAMFDFQSKVGFSKDEFPDADPRFSWSREPLGPEIKSYFYDDE